jgi:GT2 family glycosyltransferase
VDLSIIIVNWNTRLFLEDCLQSILGAAMQATYEVWVVDNASEDGSVDMLKETFPWVHTIANQTNLGFAQANNQAIQQSHGDYVLLLNPDTIVKPHSLDLLWQFLVQHPGTGGAGPRLLNPDGSLQLSVYTEPSLLREFWWLFHLDRIWLYAKYPVESWKLDQSYPVDIVMGACLLLRRKVFDTVGLLDEEYFIYSEEVDLCYRIKKAGWDLYWVPEAQVIHFGGQSTSQASEEMFLRLYQGKVIFFRKHTTKLKVGFYKLVLLSAAVIRLLFTPFVCLEPAPKRKKHLQLAKNYWRLVTRLPAL